MEFFCYLHIVSCHILICSIIYTTQLRTVSAYFRAKRRSETFLGWSFIRNFRCLNCKLGRIDQGRNDQLRIVRCGINQGRIYQGRIDQGRSDSDRSDSDRSDSDRSGVDQIDLRGPEIAECRCLWYRHRICRSSNFDMLNSDDLDYLAPSKQSASYLPWNNRCLIYPFNSP